MKKFILASIIMATSVSVFADQNISRKYSDYGDKVQEVCTNTAAHLAGKALIEKHYINHVYDSSMLKPGEKEQNDNWTDSEWVFKQISKCQLSLEQKVVNMSDSDYLEFLSSPAPFSN